MNIASQHQANYAINHFIDAAIQIGQFAALPYDEVAGAAGIPNSHIDIAAKEPYFRVNMP